MENQNLILKFKNQEQEYSFENKVLLVEDKKLIQNLSKPNIKNQDSSLIIKSLNDLHISDVIQIKINISETGYVLVSFSKESLTDETRTQLLEDIGKLKNNENPSNENSLKKVKDLLGILNNFSPIYATFSNNGYIKIELDELQKTQTSFPLLVLAQRQHKMIFKTTKAKAESVEKKEKVKKERPNKVQKEYQPFALFNSDYFFNFLFAFLAAFAITAAVFELMNKKGVAIFLIVLAVILVITLVIAVTTVVYKKGELRNPWLRYYLGIFVLVGIILGVVGSYFVCKYLLKTDIEDFDYKKMMLISSLISAVLLTTLSISRIANYLNKLRKKKKPQ